jgi:ATP-dependent Clp protease protease subunit
MKTTKTLIDTNYKKNRIGFLASAAKPRSRKKKDKTIEEAVDELIGDDEEEDEDGSVLLELPEAPKMISLVGPLDEENGAEIIHGLTILDKVGKEGEELTFTICTPGGDAYSMLAIYDLMCKLRQKMTIKTVGVGQIMSAGVLLLAAGTPGHRFIGKSSQVMMHTLKGTTHGHQFQLDAEMRQIRNMNDTYNNAITAETKMPLKKVRSIMSKKNDYFFTAEKAIELGIVDGYV